MVGALLGLLLQTGIHLTAYSTGQIFRPEYQVRTCAIADLCKKEMVPNYQVSTEYLPTFNAKPERIDDILNQYFMNENEVNKGV